MRIPDLSEDDDYNACDGAPSASVVQDPARALTVDEDTRGERLDKWLARAMPEYSRGRIQAWIEERAVRVNDKDATVRLPVWAGDRVEVTPAPAPEQLAFRAEPMAIDLVYEDDQILVLNKPQALVVHPAAGHWGGTLLNALLHRYPEAARVPRAGIVHRLDKDTTGLMVVARTIEAQTALVRQLQERTVHREYLAIVHGSPNKQGTVTGDIGRHPRDRSRMTVFKPGSHNAKPAVTHYRVLESSSGHGSGYGPTAVLACRLETGRTHQIRVHMKSLGFPMVGDPVYGRGGPREAFGRQALHAWQLGLIHPLTGAHRQWRVMPPADFMHLLGQCGFEQTMAMLREEHARGSEISARAT